MRIINARYVAVGAARGLIRVVVEEEICLVGEVLSGPPPRRRRKRREIVLNVESNIPDLSGLVPCERDLILPVVARLLEDLHREAETRGASDEEEAG